MLPLVLPECPAPCLPLRPLFQPGRPLVTLVVASQTLPWLPRVPHRWGPIVPGALVDSVAPHLGRLGRCRSKICVQWWHPRHCVPLRLGRLCRNGLRLAPLHLWRSKQRHSLAAPFVCRLCVDRYRVLHSGGEGPHSCSHCTPFFCQERDYAP